MENSERRQKSHRILFFQRPDKRFGFGSGKDLNGKEKKRWGGGEPCFGRKSFYKVSQATNTKVRSAAAETLGALNMPGSEASKLMLERTR